MDLTDALEQVQHGGDIIEKIPVVGFYTVLADLTYYLNREKGMFIECISRAPILVIVTENLNVRLKVQFRRLGLNSAKLRCITEFLIFLFFELELRLR